MLSEDVTDYAAIVAALRAWHRTNAAPPGGLGIVANPANNVWDIDYGSYGAQAGTIRMSQNNFAVTDVTVAVGGAFTPFVYNHVWPGTLSLAAISAALSCVDLSANDGARSMVILLSSESARSQLVERYVKAVLNNHVASAGEYTTLKALTAEYGHTQLHIGGQVAPGAGWAPLQTQDHLNYNLHRQNTLKVANQFDGIWGLVQAANNAT